MTSEQTKRFKYWQMRTIIATMVGYALFYFVRKNFSLAMPGLEANHVDAALIHEAAIGKIAGEQLLKLCTLGLTPEQAEEKIIQGFLK